MGCVASKFEEEEEVVTICRERKRLLKLAVERRYAFAEAHGKYFQSLYAVAAAIKLFVARHSSPSSPFYITFPPSSASSQEQERQTLSKANNPQLLRQGQCDPDVLNGVTGCNGLASSPFSGISEEETGNEYEKVVEESNYKYFYMQMPPQSLSPNRDFGWDFFYPFDVMRLECMNGYIRNNEDDLRAVREQEGIPELEDDGANHEEEEEMWVTVNNSEKKRDNEITESVTQHEIDNEKEAEQNKLNANHGSPEKGRELLDALKDIMDHFVKACDSGKNVSRMLETRNIYIQPELEEIKEKSTRFIHALPWHRGTLSKTHSCKSIVASCHNNMPGWSDYKSDMFHECGGMDSGSHSLTLERLCAWENKLYDEVKAGDNLRKLYEKKNSRLKGQMARGEGDISLDQTRAALKDLYAGILVAIRRAESMSKKIETLRDEELQPQIMELLTGLTRTWEIVLQSHETQCKIMHEVKTFEGSFFGKFSNDSHRLATLQLEAELRNWRSCFVGYIASQKAYVEALNGWLTKFLVPDIGFNSRPRYSSALQFGANGPPLLLVFKTWLCKLEKLSGKPVSYAIKCFSEDVRTLWSQQGEEQHQKRIVENLAKELERKTRAVEREESRLMGIKLIEYKPNPDAEPLIGRDHLDILSRKLQIEKNKHQNCVQRTRKTTQIGFQTGFASTFDALKEFSSALLKMYNDIEIPSEIAREEQATIEDSQPPGSR